MYNQQPTALTVGAHFGPYEIVALIGAGGMGQVYRARDTTLHRDVALKILSDAFAHDPDRLARFTREAQTLAALNHPNIAHIHGLEESDGVRALVMELVEGEDLSQRIARGPIPLDEALPIAKQIVEALEAAHEQGIIHRDLKPANIKVRSDGTVKVLDFGLAKALEPAGTTGDAANAPTITSPAMTQAGMILGTAAYMSPEQARGTPVDKRTDVWAFGCVLYEMLTRRAAFGGATIADTIAAIIEREPDWSLLSSDTPGLHLLLRRCLEKNPTWRYHDIADARIGLYELSLPPGSADAWERVLRPQHRKVRLAWTLAGLLTLSALAVFALLLESAGPPPERVVFTIPPPDGIDFYQFRLSPDGRSIVFNNCFTGDCWPRAVNSALWIRALDSLTAHAVPGTESSGPSAGGPAYAYDPFWSADSRLVAFSQRNKLWEVAVAGGAPVALGPGRSIGIWGSGADILLAPPNLRAGGVLRLSKAGDQPMSVTTADKSRDEWLHIPVAALPDGRHFLFVARSLTHKDSVWLASIDAPGRVQVMETANAAYSAGHLVFLTAGTLVAQPFDEHTGRLIGELKTIADHVAAYSASMTGTIAYRATRPARPTSLTWFDRTGRPLGTVGDSGLHQQVRLAPDGKHIVIEDNGLWVLDVATKVRSQLTTSPGTDPGWADNQSVVFAGTSGGKRGLFRRPLGGPADVLLRESDGPGRYFDDISLDGRFLASHIDREQSRLEVHPLSGNAKPIVVANAPQLDGAHFSPDGGWIAYESDETGEFEVYVNLLPALDHKKQLSVHGGTQARWCRNGKELFYLAADHTMMSVPIAAGPAASTFGTATPLFTVSDRVTLHPYGYDDYDVTADGSRFLMPAFSASEPMPTPVPITIMTNWLARSGKN